MGMTNSQKRKHFDGDMEEEDLGGFGGGIRSKPIV